MKFTVDDKHDVSKKYVEERLLMFLTWSLDGVKTDQNISARYLALLIFAVVGIVRSTTTQTRVSDATAVTFSVTCFNISILCQKHVQKVVCFITFCLFTSI